MEIKMEFEPTGTGNYEPLIIGIGHSSRVGKDTLGQSLIEEFAKHDLDALRIGFADELKRVAYVLCAQYGLETKDYYEHNPEERYKKLKAIKKTPIEVWCSLGDGLRDILYRDIWIDKLFESVTHFKCDIVIVTDVRYMNEVDAIRENGGSIIRVERPSSNGKATSIDKNLELFQYEDEVFINDGKIDKLRNYAQDFAARFVAKHRLYQRADDSSGK